MIILSQDKLQIFNFRTAKNIWIEEEEVEINQIEQIVYSIYIDGEIVGAYETKERAKEVLQEIIQKYSSYLKLEGGPAILQGQMDIQPNIFNVPKIYEMPEK